MQIVNAKQPVKYLMRNVLVAAAVLLTTPLWVTVRLGRYFRTRDACFATCSQIISVVPGILGIFLRRGFYLMTLEEFAIDCSIECATWLSHPQVRVGKGVYIGGRCTIGMCDIGDDVLIGSNVDLLSGRYQHQPGKPDVARRSQGGSFTKVRIGRNAWIGNSSVVMADVGDHSVVGAGSVVVKPIPPGCIAAGNPAVLKKWIENLDESFGRVS